MNKNFFGALILINLLLVLVFLGFSQSSSANDINNLIEEHYRLIEEGRYDEAYAMLSKESQKYISAEDFKYYRQDVGIEATKLHMIYATEVKGQLAVSCYVIKNKIKGREYALFNLSVLIKDGEKWYLVGDLSAVPASHSIDLLTLMVKAEEKMLKSGFAGLFPAESESLKKQLDLSLADNKYFLKILKKAEAEKVKPWENKDIKADVYDQEEVDASIHGSF